MNSRVVGLMAGCLASFAVSTPGADAPDQKGLYLIGDIGPSFVNNVTFDRILGVNTSASPAVEIKPGVRGTVGVGYNFIPTLGAEAELGFSYNESKTYSGIVGGVPLNGAIHLWTVPLTVGLTWRPTIPPPPKPTEVETELSLTKFFQRSRPYLGGGLSVAEKFADFDTPTTTNNNQGSGRDTVLTYYFKAGLRFPLNDRTELGVQYRFSGDTGFTIKQSKSEEIFAHTVSVALRIQF